MTPTILALGRKCRCGEFSWGGCTVGLEGEVRDGEGDRSTTPLYNFQFAPMTAEKRMQSLYKSKS